jgi:hypothetical protein
MKAIVLLADYANITGNGKINIMGMFRVIHAQAFPCSHLSAHLIITLYPDMLENVQGEHTLIARLVNEDGDVLNQMEIPFVFPGQKSQMLRPEHNFIVNLPVIEFEKPGGYAFEVYVDSLDKVVGEVAFYVDQLPAENG